LIKPAGNETYHNYNSTHDRINQRSFHFAAS